MEKFFKYLLTDTHEESLSNLLEHALKKKHIDKNHRHLAGSLFVTNRSVRLSDVLARLRNYLSGKSVSFAGGGAEAGPVLERRFSNCGEGGEGLALGEGELMVVEARVKVDNQHIEELPLRVTGALRKVEGARECGVWEWLKGYSQPRITYVIAYYGEYNFELIRKENFTQTVVTLFGKEFKLNIQVVFVSRLALMETFRTINKVPNLEYINDLIIQFYELKREKAKRKRQRQHGGACKEVKQVCKWWENVWLWWGGVVVVGAGVLGVAVVLWRRTKR